MPVPVFGGVPMTKGGFYIFPVHLVPINHLRRLNQGSDQPNLIQEKNTKIGLIKAHSQFLFKNTYRNCWGLLVIGGNHDC